MAVDPLAKKMNAMVRDTEHYKRVVLSVQTFNAKKTFTDLCFVCAKGHKVYAHKLLFCTVSTLLKEMFLEIQDNLQTIFVHLPDIESRMMELLLDFLYEGAVKVSQSEYTNFQGIMNTLGIVLTPPTANSERGRTTQQTVQPIPQPQQQITMLQQQQQLQSTQQQLPVPQQQLQSPQQPTQLLYMPTTPNAQGQVQYVLATPNQLNQGQVIQGPLMSPVVAQQAPGQMVQNGTQVMNSHQGNMMQMVQQNNSQVVPMNQMGGQIVMQGNQNIVSSNQLQLGMQAQMTTPTAINNFTSNHQQQPQYVMASNTNQLTNNRMTTQYRRGQGGVRGRPALPATHTQQQTRFNNEAGGEHTGLVETIKSILQENSVYAEQLTAKKIRESLEQKFDKDLSFMEEEIDCMLKSYDMQDNKNFNLSEVSVSGSSINSVNKTRGPNKLTNRKQKKRKKLPYCNSDDEADVDFDPKKKLGRLKKKYTKKLQSRE